MNTVDITIVDIDDPPETEEVEWFCLRVLEELELDNWELSVVFCTNEFIRGLNNRFRGIDRATDVLSFSQSEGDPFPNTENVSRVVGDVIVSLEMVEKNSRDFGVSPHTELNRLLVHGILHLAGYNHPEDAEEAEMLDLQDRLLRKIMEERTHP